MRGAAFLAAAITVLMTARVTGQSVEQDCDTGPSPPSDLAAFIWVNSGFEDKGSSNEDDARERLRVDFLCQESIDGLGTTFSAVLPISDIDTSTACSVPLDSACNLLSSCPSLRNGVGRRLSQCMPFFGCPLGLWASKSVPEKMAPGEVLVEPPLIEQTMRPEVTLSMCFDGICSILSIDGGQGSVIGVLAYGLCPDKYANAAAGDWTSLHWAAIMGAALDLTAETNYYKGALPNFQLSIRALVNNGADLEAQDSEGFTPLHLASKWGIYPSTEIFIDVGADVEAKDHAGNTPLAIAAAFGRGAVIELLLEGGANPNVRYIDDEAKTPLHFATLYAQMSSTVELLIKAGADVHSVDNGGDTPLDIAERYGRARAIELLKEAGSR